MMTANEAISTRAPLRSRYSVSRQITNNEQLSTLAFLPRYSTKNTGQLAWDDAFQRLGMFASLSDGWNLEKAVPPNFHTIQYAGEILAGIKMQNLPAPTVNPSPDGAIYAHWNSSGLDIELIIEAPYDIYVLIDDCHADLNFEGPDLNLQRTVNAISQQIART